MIDRLFHGVGMSVPTGKGTLVYIPRQVDLRLAWRGFVLLHLVVNFSIPMRESRIPSSEGLSGKHPARPCEKSAGCFVFCATVCDIFFVNLGKLTSVWKERHLARFLVLSGEVFVFRSCLFQKTIVKINFNEYEKLIESGHSSFMKKITPKFSKCRRCGNVLKSHSKRYCGLRCSGIKPRWEDH